MRQRRRGKTTTFREIDPSYEGECYKVFKNFRDGIRRHKGQGETGIKKKFHR